MKLVVIESPYAGDIERNVTYARRAVKDCLLQGYAPFASHLLYTQPGILKDSIFGERRLGVTAGFAWAKKADLILFYIDYGYSDGMLNARALLKEIGLIPMEERLIGLNPSNTPNAFGFRPVD